MCTINPDQRWNSDQFMSKVNEDINKMPTKESIGYLIHAAPLIMPEREQITRDVCCVSLSDGYLSSRYPPLMSWQSNTFARGEAWRWTSGELRKRGVSEVVDTLSRSWRFFIGEQTVAVSSIDIYKEMIVAKTDVPVVTLVAQLHSLSICQKVLWSKNVETRRSWMFTNKF